jgi:hypothetical protein
MLNLSSMSDAACPEIISVFALFATFIACPQRERKDDALSLNRGLNVLELIRRIQATQRQGACSNLDSNC